MAAPKLKLNNYAKPEPQSGGQDYFRWKVFVDVPESVLAEIKEVEYTLHPTFPNPVRISRDRNARFALEASGWGEFTILARLRLNDGSEHSIPYWLDLHKPWRETK